MSETKSRLPRYLASVAIYLIVVASAFGFNVIRSRAARTIAEAAPPPGPTIVSSKPYFSLTTNRTYSPNETARMWASSTTHTKWARRKRKQLRRAMAAAFHFSSARIG